MRKLASLFYQWAKVLLGSRAKQFAPVRAAQRLILSYLKATYAVVDGHPMHLDRRDSLFLSVNHGAYEPFETELIKKEIKRNYTVLDLGANIGYYSLIFARLVGNRGKVFAFEPDESNAALLEKNVEINGYRNVCIVKKAVSDKTEKNRLYLSKENFGDHRIYDSGDRRQSIEIETVRLDDLFKNRSPKIDFIKMDIQGAEGGALLGMSELLKTSKNLKILSEFWPFGLKKFGTEPQEYLRRLEDFGFKLYEVKKLEKKLEPVNIPTLLNTYTLQKQNHTNLLCRKEN
ncbi:MAG: FkbM family methyltransferase [candidate division Zixibacteria bacterium]|nr:FkbM family methyltransferase [candidate division Zixibacteria bacterium]